MAAFVQEPSKEVKRIPDRIMVDDAAAGRDNNANERRNGKPDGNRKQLVDVSTLNQSSFRALPETSTHRLASAQSERNQSCSTWSKPSAVFICSRTYHNQGRKVGNRSHRSLDHAPGQIRAMGGAALVHDWTHATRFLDGPYEECNSGHGDEVCLYREEDLDLVDGEPNGNQAECPEEEEPHECLCVGSGIGGHAVWHVVLTGSAAFATG